MFWDYNVYRNSLNILVFNLMGKKGTNKMVLRKQKMYNNSLTWRCQLEKYYEQLKYKFENILWESK